MSEPQSLNPTPKFLRVAIRVMVLSGLCAIAYVILQSCSLPKKNLHKFATGDLNKLVVLAPTPAQPNRQFSSPEGGVKSLQDFRGQVVILNVWATWCVPCVAEIPSLDQLQSEYGSLGLKIVAVSMDRHRIEAESFYKTANVQSLKLYHDSELAMGADVGVQSLPISIFYDRGGQEIARIAGEVDWQSQDVKIFLSHILN